MMAANPRSSTSRSVRSLTRGSSARLDGTPTVTSQFGPATNDEPVCHGPPVQSVGASVEPTVASPTGQAPSTGPFSLRTATALPAGEPGTGRRDEKVAGSSGVTTTTDPAPDNCTGTASCTDGSPDSASGDRVGVIVAAVDRSAGASQAAAAGSTWEPAPLEHTTRRSGPITVNGPGPTPPIDARSVTHGVGSVGASWAAARRMANSSEPSTMLMSPALDAASSPAWVARP